jgi:hypothetical protein
VFRFYGTGSVNSDDTVDSYSVSTAMPENYCGSTINPYELYSPDPTDSPAGNAAVYDETPGDAWCEGGVSFPRTLNGSPVAGCVGVSSHTFNTFHVAPDGLITTLPPVAVVDNNDQSCRSLQSSPDLVAGLLSNNTLVTNPFGSSPATVTIATAVKEALVGSTTQLGGSKESTYDYWEHLAETTPRMAAAVINDQSAASPSIPLPTVGSPSSLSYGDGVTCSSDLDYVSSSTSNEVNYGACTIPVMRQVVEFSNGTNTTWALPEWTSSSAAATDWVYAGARFDNRTGNTAQTPATNWRKIIYNDVLSGQIRSGTSGTVAGPTYGFPWSAYINNGIYATANDQITAAQQASEGADCYFGSGGVVSGSATTSTTAGTTTGFMPPANAIIQVAIQPDPTYGATGGTLHPNTFTAIATGLLCPDPSSGAYEDCNTLYPGQYVLNSVNWHLSLDSDSAAYQECAAQTQQGCQFYIAQQNNVGPLVAYFYSATQPGVALNLNVTGISGSYTIYPSTSSTPGSTTSSGSILFCGDGTFNNNQSGLSELSCISGGGVTLTPPATESSFSSGTTSSKTIQLASATLTCSAGWTLSGSTCTRTVVSITTSKGCAAAGMSWNGSSCTTSTGATSSTGTSGGTGGSAPTTTTTLPLPITVQLNSSNVIVSGQRTVTVLGASSTPGS